MRITHDTNLVIYRREVTVAGRFSYATHVALGLRLGRSLARNQASSEVGSEGEQFNFAQVALGTYAIPAPCIHVFYIVKRVGIPAGL
jgi:hypothetical protein